MPVIAATTTVGGSGSSYAAAGDTVCYPAASCHACLPPDCAASTDGCDSASADCWPVPSAAADLAAAAQSIAIHILGADADTAADVFHIIPVTPCLLATTLVLSYALKMARPSAALVLVHLALSHNLSITHHLDRCAWCAARCTHAVPTRHCALRVAFQGGLRDAAAVAPQGRQALL